MQNEITVYFPVFDVHDENFNIINDIERNFDLGLVARKGNIDLGDLRYDVNIMLNTLCEEIKVNYLKDKNVTSSLKLNVHLDEIDLFINNELFIKTSITSREVDISRIVQQEVDKLYYNNSSLENNRKRVQVQHEALTELLGHCRKDHCRLISVEFSHDDEKYRSISAIAVVFNYDTNRLMSLSYDTTFNSWKILTIDKDSNLYKVEDMSIEFIIDFHKVACSAIEPMPF